MTILKKSLFPSAGLALACAVAVAQAPVKIAVTNEVVRENFRGVGFHGQLFLDSSTPEYWD